MPTGALPARWPVQIVGLVGGDCGSGQEVGEGALGGGEIGTQSGEELVEMDPVIGVEQLGYLVQSRGKH